jgi:hypothetical protein
MHVSADILRGLVVSARMHVLTLCMWNLILSQAHLMSLLKAYNMVFFVRTSRPSFSVTNVCVHAINMCVLKDIEVVVPN